MSDLRPAFRDETDRIFCSKCGHWFLMSAGATEVDPEQRRRGDRIRAITRAHIEMCGGDAAVTLAKIEQAYKSGELKLR